MPNIRDTIHSLQLNWKTPRGAMHNGHLSPFSLQCRFSGPANAASIHSIPSAPPELIEFWQVAETADLFKDCHYGQWGLTILGPTATRSATEEFLSDRPSEYREGDLVVGKFSGDSDLLILRNARQLEDYRNVIIATPIDKRSEWYLAASNFTEFLHKFEQEQGAKFWECRGED